MKITVGQLRRLVREAADGSGSPADLKAAAAELFSALKLNPTGSNPPRSSRSLATALKSPGVKKPDPGVLSFLDVKDIFDGPVGEPVTLRWLVSKFRWAATMTAQEANKAPSADAPFDVSRSFAAAAAWLRSAASSVDLDGAQKVRAPRGESPNDPFGRYAFSRDRVRGRAVPFETDTDLEAEVYSHLVKHFQGNVPLPPDSVGVLRDLLAAGKYSDIIHEPSAKTLYRGIGAGPRWIRKILGLGPGDPVPPEGTAEVDYTYTSSGGAATSWSSSKSVALEFMRSAAADSDSNSASRYSILMTATVASNPGVFIAGPNGLYNLTVASLLEDEKESLALGPVVIKSVTWADNTAAGRPRKKGKSKP